MNIENKDYKNLYDSYNIFLLTCKYPQEQIQEYRKNALINCYADIYDIPDECLNDLQTLYKNNVKDTYDKKLIPTVPISDHQEPFEEYDDIKEHYGFIESKYKYFSDLVHKLNNPQEDHLDDNYFENYSDMDKESCMDEDTYDDDSHDEMYDEDTYEDYEDEYYSDEDYY